MPRPVIPFEGLLRSLSAAKRQRLVQAGAPLSEDAAAGLAFDVRG